MRLTAAIALLLAVLPSAQATGPVGLTVTDLLERCQKLENPDRPGKTGPIQEPRPDGAYCLGHMDGFRETLKLSVALHRKRGFKKDWKSVVGICIPGRQVSSDSLARIFIHWAKANAQRASEPATIGIYEAFRQAYPCVDTYR